MGKVIEVVDLTDFRDSVREAKEFISQEEHQAEKLFDSPSFRAVWFAKKYDDYFLDPIVGFVLPGFGDALSIAATFPALYVSAIKIRSIKLFLAVFGTMITDFLVGIIPIAGDIVDAFYKSSKISCRLIVGYIEDDAATKREINKRATWCVVGLIAFGLLCWLAYTAILALYHWAVGLF